MGLKKGRIISLIKWNVLVAFMLFGYEANAQYNDSTFYHVSFAPTGSINKANGNTAYLLNNNLKFNIRKRTSRSTSPTPGYMAGKTPGLPITIIHRLLTLTYTREAFRIFTIGDC